MIIDINTFECEDFEQLPMDDLLTVINNEDQGYFLDLFKQNRLLACKQIFLNIAEDIHQGSDDTKLVNICEYAIKTLRGE